MKNWMLRGAGVIAMSTSLLACVGMEDDLVETDLAADEVDLAAGDVTAKAAAPRLVPLVVELYQHFNYDGDVRYIIRQEGMLGRGDGCTPGHAFGDVVSSVKVRKGPDYDEWVERYGGTPYVYLWQDNVYRGRRLALTVGGYPDLRELDFENVTSSITLPTLALPPADLREPTQTVFEHGRISVILEAHTEPQNLRCVRDNYKVTILRSHNNLDRAFGAAFNDKISSIDVIPGTSFDATNKFTLHVDPNYTGYKHGFYQDVGLVPDLRDLGIDNQVSSIHVDL